MRIRVWLSFCAHISFLLSIVFATAESKAAPAFPGAEGFGAKAVGGRGGKVFEVTNLNDSGPGSLRACVDASVPRTCVFRVGGTIVLKTQLGIMNPFITIAGQTAPGGGITLRIDPSSTSGPLKIWTHDVIVRYIRFRPGTGSFGSSSGESERIMNIDALTIGNNRQRDQLYNIIVDHCSLSWGGDENLNIWDDARDVTIQWSIVSEALHCVPGASECHSKGVIIGSAGSQRITFHHNLMAQNVGRNPLVKMTGPGALDWVNNVVHAPGEVGGGVYAEYGASGSNWVGNYFQSADTKGYGLWKLDSGGCLNQYFVEGNIDKVHRPSLSDPEANFVRPDNNGRSCIVSTRFDAPPVTTSSPFQAFTDVLENAGVTFPSRDPVDERVVREVRTGIYRTVDSPDQVGGWPQLLAGAAPVDSDHDGMPDEWEVAHGRNSRDPSDGPVDSDGNGYTNLEEYLNGLVGTEDSTSPEPAPVPAPIPTVAPAPSPSPKPSAAPAPVPSPKPSAAPAPLPSPKPSAAPAPVPSPKPSAAPAPSPKPTAAPSSSPAPRPSPDLEEDRPRKQRKYNRRGRYENRKTETEKERRSERERDGERERDSDRRESRRERD